MVAFCDRWGFPNLSPWSLASGLDFLLSEGPPHGIIAATLLELWLAQLSLPLRLTTLHAEKPSLILGAC